MMSEDPGDIELVRRASAGDRRSLDELGQRMSERVHAYVNRTVLNRDEAQDLAQETVMHVLASLDTLEDPARFWSWVFAITTNLIRRHWRQQMLRRAAQMSAIDPARFEQHQAKAEGGLDRLLRQEEGARTAAALGRLDERHRIVLALRCFEGRPHAEIAWFLGCSELTARCTFFRAKRALRRELGVGEGMGPLASRG